MKKAEISFESIPSSARHAVTLTICLKCAFDFFTKQLKLAPRTAYSELKQHTPEEADFTGSATSRPHFFLTPEIDHCPYCNAPMRWFASFRSIRIDAHPDFERARKKLWTTLRKQPTRFYLFNPGRTQMQIFSEWLERLKRGMNLDGDSWMLKTAVEQVKRSNPVTASEEDPRAGVHSVGLLSPGEEQEQKAGGKLPARKGKKPAARDWRYDQNTLYVSRGLYGDILLIQQLISRSHLHGGRTLEGRLTLQELVARLGQLGCLQAMGVDAREPAKAFEQAVLKLVASGPTAVYYAVDRSDYLEHLKSVYNKKRDK